MPSQTTVSHAPAALSLRSSEGGSSVCVRSRYFRKWTYSVFGTAMMSGATAHLQDTYYVPQQAGSVVAVFDCPEQDAAFYGPVFRRLRLSFRSGMPPPINLPE